MNKAQTRDVFVNVLYKPMLTNFTPLSFNFGTTKETKRHFISCNYSYVGAQGKTQTGKCVLGYSPVELAGTHKIIGLTDDGEQIKLRRLRELPSPF